MNPSNLPAIPWASTSEEAAELRTLNNRQNSVMGRRWMKSLFDDAIDSGIKRHDLPRCKSIGELRECLGLAENSSALMVETIFKRWVEANRPKESRITSAPPIATVFEAAANANTDLPPKPDPIAVAVALLKDHPELSARKLAKQCGCAPSTLTRSRLFRTAKSLATGKRDRHRGWKGADGAIDAIADND